MSEKEKKEKEGLSRRSFLKRTGAVGAGIAAAGPLSKLFSPDSAMADEKFKGGYAGKILHIDLGHGNKIDTWTEPTYKYAAKYMGARGIHDWMIFNEVPIDADVLSPESLLCLGAGPLVGTLFPGSNRLECTTLNVQTGSSCHSSSGSAFASEMKYAGYDHIIIRGKASKPSYLFIEDGKVMLEDAKHLWGKNAIEARNIVRTKLGDKWICSIGIGVAGENLSKMAMITGDAWHASAGFGTGAMMGSKKLKLIAIRGHGAVKVSDPENFKTSIDSLRARKEMDNIHWLEMWAGGYERTGVKLPRTRNVQWHGPEGYQTYTEEETTQVNQQTMDDLGYSGKRYSCRHCAWSNHGTFYKITNGPHAGVKCKWIMTCWRTTYFSMLDPEPVTEDLIRFVSAEDSYGLDDSAAGATIAWAFECYQRGLLTLKDTGGLDLTWPRENAVGNEVIFQTLEAIAYRKGKLGKLLADGAHEAAKKLGNRIDALGRTPAYYVVGTPKGANCSDQGNGPTPGQCEDKGYHEPGTTPDIWKTISLKWSFGCAVSTRGGKHSDGTVGEGPDPSTMSEDEYKNMDIPYIYDEAGRYVSYNEWLKSVYDFVGQCWVFRLWTVDEIAQALNYAIGSNHTGQSLINKGRQLLNISKAINTIRKGFTREHDIPEGRVRELLEPYDMNKFTEQLDKYYDFHGWDRETGWQKGSTLLDLGLPGVAWALWKEGKLK